MDKSVQIERVKKGETETSIRLRIQPDIKQRLIVNQEKAGFKSLSQFLIYRGLEEAPPRKAPTKHRTALIKALANLGLIRKYLADRPEDLRAVISDIELMAHMVHEAFDYDS